MYYGNNYSMVAGMQKRKLEQKDDVISQKDEIIEALKKEIVKLGGNPDTVLKQFYEEEEEDNAEDICKDLFENLERTVQRIRKQSKDEVDLNYLTTHLLIKAEKSKSTEETYILLRGINNSINNCTKHTSLSLYSKILLREIVKGNGNYRTTIIHSFQTIFSTISSLVDLDLHKDVVANSYKGLVELYQSNTGSVKRSIGIAIERCNYINFKEVIDRTECKDLYAKWSNMELYNKDKWK